MKKRFYSALQCCDHCPPGPDTSGSVCSVCCMHTAVVSWLLYPSDQSSAEALFACCGQYLVPGLTVVSFNFRCAVVCLWNETSYHHCWNQGFPKLPGREIWWGQGFGLVFWGRMLAAQGLRQAWPGRVVPLEHREVGFGASKLSSECWPCAGSHRWLCVYAKGWGGQWHLPVPLFPKGSLCENCLSATCSSLCALSALQIVLSSCMLTGCLVAFSPSPNVLWAVPEPSTLTLKTPGFKPHWL